MAAPVEMTLQEARLEVLQRLGFTSQGTATLRNADLVNTFIRRAARQLYHEANWSSMHRDLTFDLFEGLNRYDIPDETDYGQMLHVWVLDENRVPHELRGGISVQDLTGDPSDETLRVETGRPDMYQIIDQEIRLYPAPNDTYPAIRMSYIARMPKLVDDEERLPFDSELIVQQAVILGMRHYQKPGISDNERDLAKYLRRVKAQQREPRNFTVGGHKSRYVTNIQRTSNRRARRNGDGAPWYPGWNP